MNADHSKNYNFNSETGIFDTYFAPAHPKARQAEEFLVRLFSMLCACLRTLTSERVRRVARTFGVIGSLVGLICVVAAVEAGSLGLGSGLLLGGLCLLPEVGCLMRH